MTTPELKTNKEREMKFIIFWDAGYGQSYEVVDADSAVEADKTAYEQWLQEAETNANYGSEPWSEEREQELEENGDL